MSFLRKITDKTDKLINKMTGNTGAWLNDLTGSSDMLKQEYKNNIALWNMQNEYNTPAAQIARMKAAGIDVNPMTYAVGNGSMSTTASNISAPSVGASGVNPLSTLMSVMGGIEGIKAQRLANSMTKKDLDFYEKHGYRPGTSDWMTIIPALLDKFMGSGKSSVEYSDIPKPVKPSDFESRSKDNRVLKYKGKPFISRGRVMKVKDTVI